MMEKDNIDLHKTKQLAWVLFSLTERGLRDEIWTEEIADSAVVTRNLVKATTVLIKGNHFSLYEEDSTLTGEKNTIPLCIDGFRWLAKTVDNLIMQSVLVSPASHQDAVQLKNDFFQYSVHRLAGGLDNHQKDERFRMQADTFSIEVVKHSVSNMIEHPLEFTLPENMMSAEADQSGDVVVQIPSDRKIFSGSNVLVAAMYTNSVNE